MQLVINIITRRVEWKDKGFGRVRQSENELDWKKQLRITWVSQEQAFKAMKNFQKKLIKTVTSTSSLVMNILLLDVFL